MFFLIVFWGISSVVVCVQYPRLLVNETTGMREEYNPGKNSPFYDPWKDDPWSFDLTDHHHSILEATATLLGFFYGLMRMSMIALILYQDDQEARWTDFWRLCETL